MKQIVSKIYLKTGIGFLALFVASVVVVTLIQTNNNGTDMGRAYMNSTNMGTEVVNNVISYNKAGLTAEQLMWEINGKINGFMSDSWNNHHVYSSVLLLDSNRKVISRSGYMLQIAPKTGSEDHWYIPLSRFCSDEQINLIYRTFHSQIRGKAIFVNGEIKGYIDHL